MGAFGVSLFDHSPIWLQERLFEGKALVRKVLREGNQFRRAMQEVRESQWLGEEALRDYQLSRMRGIVRHAARYVPYYQEQFRRAGIVPAELEALEDFSRIPLLSKGDVVSAGRMLLSRKHHGLKIKGATSGSTGLSLEGYRDLAAIVRENAFVWRQLEWAGMRRGDRRAWIRGDMIVPLARREPPYWRMNRVDNMLMLSSFHLSESSAPEYIQAMEHYDPCIIQAYPSSISFLARSLEARGKLYSGQSLKGIVTSSETLLPDQRDVIETRFKCKVFDWYGSYERVAAIGTCEHGRYHIISDYGLVELLPSDDGRAEIVGTGFDNFVMPLLRYRTGDAVIPAEAGERCDCGRSFPVVKNVVGRIDDYVKTPDGRQIGMFAIIFDGLRNIWEVQAIQEARDEIRILVVPMREFGVEDEREIVARAQNLVGPAMRIRVERVTEIKRTERGKIRTVICRV